MIRTYKIVSSDRTEELTVPLGERITEVKVDYKAFKYELWGWACRKPGADSPATLVSGTDKKHITANNASGSVKAC